MSTNGPHRQMAGSSGAEAWSCGAATKDVAEPVTWRDLNCDFSNVEAFIFSRIQERGIDSVRRRLSKHSGRHDHQDGVR